MSDQLPYTINDPSSVECPHCHQTMDLSSVILEAKDFGGDCELCNRYIQFEVQQHFVVLAWKPGERPSE